MPNCDRFRCHFALVIHPHFVLVYEVDSQWGKVYILRVLHTAQKWP
ncbi:type II toxin-antitoxin system RelE/ParE family toxin [Salmonella enterica subsp. enterica serovar Derby]|nr:type II toxin-antitoxin system RelE/ParE family toxin [Salmonella enterica subsp. enterica serovar Derby]EBK1531839.1 type II toxin-antitoxin system RelE/ParE family toxin [Salmonella enterica subsp. enterica serovar Derby]EBM9510242.1 type II toxin-antitoxin system RelE/ParE family toxin [Salmonella enterica subsp. enterica serovar Derby]EBM9511131.1 type II toxin-antitoxin system RelE/ParE family toxin [Salmonella enterica subsp. enterica serovar Derby]